MKICVLPIDNRPVCYNLVKDITAIDEDITLYIPDRELLGGLIKNADIEGLFSWLKSVPKVDAMVLSLDTIAYGGLIPSRRSPDSFDTIKNRLEKLKNILKEKDAKIYAFSSIMRISNNNINQEEKEYWNKYGKKIFDYSYQCHKNGCESCIQNLIPSAILDDYMDTRKRNFEINKIYLEWQKEGLFNTLVFSKDDCAEYGFNVQEAKKLEELGGFTKTGADEIPLTLLARAVEKDLKIAPVFLEDEHKELISKYEDVSIENSVKGQLSLAGIEITTVENADIVLMVNNFKDHQGEIVMKVATEPFNKEFSVPKKPYMVADVRFANGSDNAFVKELFKTKYTKDFYGYSAWNTSANTLGSLLCGAKVKYNAKKYNDEAFKRLQTIRLTDDWAYQANIRQTLTMPESFDIEPFKAQISKFLEYNCDMTFSYPWNRLFEIEVTIK